MATRVNESGAAARERYIYSFTDWLFDEIIPDMFPDAPPERPPFRVSFGSAPGMRGSRRRKILGACMNRASSSDGHNEIFLDITGDDIDTPSVLATFIHELCHAIDDNKSGHSGRFAQLARAFNLDGPLTSTTAGSELNELLAYYVSENGELPAGAIKTSARRPKQSTRMRKVWCADDECGFHFRTSASQIDKLPHNSACPACAGITLRW